MTKAEPTIGTGPEQRPRGAARDAQDETPGGAAKEAPAGADSAPADSGDAGSADAPAPRGPRRIPALLSVAVVAYAIDLITKILVVEHLEGNPPIDVVGEYLRFHAIRNPGAAFGIGEALTVFLTLTAMAVVVVIARIARRLHSLPWAIALGLLLGGALGNLTDRIFRSPGVFEGHVVDFIAPAHFAIFNIADSAIVCGGILIVWLSFRGLDPDGTVHED
ncbi:signal peptidase II [Streptomyces sp. HB2AG]|uniref:signal peptidase II n=1 Tax=Streptomyces sp. HB2AG TaxID=2983400 RepID=UPI0022AA08FF|nr:signal peptidase II [Streptomyces sp. HB2AG]MCZ2526494.1 signal peptidase II [Streptomyces sp. HB2AG]